ncbi:hypothetical protein FUAX_12020 [Fulvitalea axinellae]|uniref:TonB C-terminal domain-containing protein n=1 Tax=Fulvitalea axinellae TaxID=1182444 RepID=A0AAU9DD33_9BACT|nr:hypothetical protein FUAX_12020 [Fulvitalea axinellae]
MRTVPLLLLFLIGGSIHGFSQHVKKLHYISEGQETLDPKKANFYLEVPVLRKKETNVRHGKAQAFYIDGKKKFTGEYRQNLRHGIFQYFNKEGMKISEGEYANNEKFGIWKYWNEKGAPTLECKHLSFKQIAKVPANALWSIIENDRIIINQWNAQGEQTVTKGNGIYSGYYPNGKLKETGTLNRGRKTGTWRGYYTNGNRFYEEVYENNNLISGQSFDIEGAPEEYKVPYSLPIFKTGLKDFYSYVNEKLKYPKNAKKMRIQGPVYVKFSVSPQGAVENPTIVKGIGFGCDDEAIRLIEKTSGKWASALHKGKEISYDMTLPIVFKL